jgi:hypothetical protein
MPIDQHSMCSVPILPFVTINVQQSTVVHQTVLSFGHCRGNLNSIAFQFRLLGHELLARPPFRVLWRRASTNGRIATNEKFGSRKDLDLSCSPGVLIDAFTVSLNFTRKTTTCFFSAYQFSEQTIFALQHSLPLFQTNARSYQIHDQRSFDLPHS